MAENAIPSKGFLNFGKSASQGYLPFSLTDTGALNINGSISASLGAFVPASQFSLSPTTSSSSVAISGGTAVLIQNTGANDAYIKFGASATTSDILIKSGAVIQLDSGGGGTLAAITASGSTTLRITTGSGLAMYNQAGGSGGGGGNVNLNQVGGVAYALGQGAMSASMSVCLASDQSNIPLNLKQVNGSAFALGQTTKSASLPVTLASDQGNLAVAVQERSEISGTSSAAGVFSNFPLTDTNGARHMSLQVTAIAAGSTIVAEESNDGTTWTNLISLAGAASVTATGLHQYNFSAKQIRVRQSVYGGSGSSSVTAEFRLDPAPFAQAYGAGAVDARTNRVVLASDDALVTVAGTTSDTAYNGSGNSTLSASLRGIYSKLGSVVLAAGTALIGKVGIDQTTPGTTNAVMATNFPATADVNSGNVGASTLRMCPATNSPAIANWGQGATGSAVPSGAQYKGLMARTTTPSAGSDGNLVGAMADKFGRQIVMIGNPRDLKGKAQLTLSGSTSETTFITAGGAGVFNDIYKLVLTNTDTTNGTEVELRDATAGSLIETFYVPPKETRGFTVPSSDAMPQTTANNNWTLKCITAVTALKASALYNINK
jgi:hypothetical protein